MLELANFEESFKQAVHTFPQGTGSFSMDHSDTQDSVGSAFFDNPHVPALQSGPTAVSGASG